ncbi:hypothetical protein diail_6710 [Diaporthe ilicicola]|nr:hypothetical protein diail_6710 [Diaporthe ilicicola]
MDSWAAEPSVSGDSVLEPSRNEVDQDSSSAWLDFVDWTLSDSDTWNDGTQPNTSAGDFAFDDFDFQGFGDQFVGENTTSTSSHFVAREQSDTFVSSLDETRPGPPDSPSSPIMDQKIVNRRLEEIRGFERARAEIIEIPSDAERSASRSSPSRRKGRLSDLVKKGIEELKNAKGACWRCKILRKKLRDLLVASSQYAAEVGDDKLVIMSLVSLRDCLNLWRLHINGLLYHGMHNSCDASSESGCRFKCFADLQLHIKDYTAELSRVLLRKKALQSDRRWWLSVFYSLCFQALVRQTLIMVQAEVHVESLVNDALLASVKQYCYTAVNILDAASAGWDPISSDDDLGPLLVGSDLDRNMAKHITRGRKIMLTDDRSDERHCSFEYLEDLFKMDRRVRVRRRGPTKGTPIKDFAFTAQPASITDPKLALEFSDSEYGTSADHNEQVDSETEFPFQSTPPPGFENWEALKKFKKGANKRRAASPPQEHDSVRRLSTGSFSQCLRSRDDTSDRANSISSVNSFSSINAAYGTLALDPYQAVAPRPVCCPETPALTPRTDIQQLGVPEARGTKTVLTRPMSEATNARAGTIQGLCMCDSCPEKPKKFDTREELGAHEAKKHYECAYCGTRFKNKDEADRHQNSLHVRKHSWSCSTLGSYDRAFSESKVKPGQADTCGFCGEDFDRTGTTKYSRYASDEDWDERVLHLQEHHRFRECNSSKKFYRVDHFRQHLKHSHASKQGRWIDTLEASCMLEEDMEPPLPNSARPDNQ